jgi:hypothetical protein
MLKQSGARRYPARGLVCCLAAIFATSVLIACGGGDDTVDATGGRELLARVQNENYRSWRRAPGWDSRLPSIGGGHGGQLDIYVNDVVAAILDNGGPVKELPAGAAIVKDVWNGTDLHAIAIMDKRADGWYWAEFSGFGEVSAAGHPAGCINCHQSGVDYVRAFVLP